jgi:hypothetical protein
MACNHCTFPPHEYHHRSHCVASQTTDTTTAALCRQSQLLISQWIITLQTIMSEEGVFCDVTPCGSCKNRRFGETYRLQHQDGKKRRARNNVHHPHTYIPFQCLLSHTEFLRSLLRLLVTANVVPTSPILVTLMMVAPSSSETSVLTRGTRPSIPGDDIRHSYRRENLKYYTIVQRN